MSLIAAAIAAPGAAVAEVPLAARYSTNEPGAIWVTGSTLMTCPAAAATCAASQAGTETGAALSNNGYQIVQVNADADPATFNASGSTFAPPAAYKVLFAGLYFGGRVTAGPGGAGRRAAAARRVRVCDLPGTGLRLRSTSRGGLLRDGRACWRLGKIMPGRTRRLTVVARVTGRSGVVSNAARARSANLRGRGPAVSVARVQVAPLAPEACAAATRPQAHAAC